MKYKWIRGREEEGMRVPHWYLGYSHYEFDRDISVYYIIPVNIIVAAIRWLLTWTRYRVTHALSNKSLDKRLKYMIRSARYSTYRSGYNDAITIINSDIKKQKVLGKIIVPENFSFDYLRKAE